MKQSTHAQLCTNIPNQGQQETAKVSSVENDKPSPRKVLELQALAQAYNRG